MSYSATEDWTTLPEALLPVVKDHCRVDFDDDDATLTRCIRWAIDYCQTYGRLQVCGADGTWLPDVTGAARLQCPAQPVSAYGVMSDAVDVSADYALEVSGMTTWLVHGDGTAIPAGIEVTLTTGYADADSLPPKMEADILRAAATFYEHRESVTTFSVDQMPGFLSDMMTGLWVPRA